LSHDKSISVSCASRTTIAATPYKNHVMLNYPLLIPGRTFLPPKTAPYGLAALLAAKDSTYGLAALRAWSQHQAKCVLLCDKSGSSFDNSSKNVNET
jgi:hypothetical protein